MPGVFSRGNFLAIGSEWFHYTRISMRLGPARAMEYCHRARNSIRDPRILSSHALPHTRAILRTNWRGHGERIRAHEDDPRTINARYLRVDQSRQRNTGLSFRSSRNDSNDVREKLHPFSFRIKRRCRDIRLEKSKDNNTCKSNHSIYSKWLNVILSGP